MSDLRRVTLLVGLSVTATVTAAARVGWLTPLERESIDLRFERAPRRPRPMTDEILHVDIDDGALDSVGRWPWDRSILADAIDELVRAGARTIALDLVLSNPQRPEHRPDGEVPIEHDVRLAEALARVPCLLAMKLHQTRLGAVWSTEEGQRQLERLLTRLARGVDTDSAAVAREVGLTGDRRERFLARPLALKELAAWRALGALESRFGASLTYAQFLQTVAPGVGRHTGRFAEQPMLERLWAQRASWRALQHHLVAGPGAGGVDDVAPTPALAAVAGGAGFVNMDRLIDADGEVRSMPPSLPAPGGAAIQLGVAAATRHLGVSLDMVEIDERSIRIGGQRLPLRDGRLWIDWATSDTTPAWEGVFRRHASEPARVGHLSIAALVSLAEQRRRLEAMQRRFDRLGSDLAAFVLQDPALAGTAPSGEVLAMLRDEVAFRIEDHEGLLAEGAVELPAEELAQVYQCREWQALDRAIASGRSTIGAAEGTVRRQVRDRLVFVGWTAGGSVADFVATPLGPLTPGVVVHAALADMVLTGRFVRFGPAFLEAALTLLLGIMATLLASRLTAGSSVLAIGALLAAYVGIVLWSFSSAALVLPLVAPLLGCTGAWLAGTVLQSAISQHERRRVTRQFRARVSTQLVDFLRANPDAVSMDGEQREITALFADLAGFTNISEQLGGPATVRTLNRYLGELTQALIAEGAYVNKFLGDGLMAFWSAFAPDPEQCSRACRAALSCLEVVSSLNQSARWPGAPPVSVRIGLATGLAVVGDCGAPPLLNDYTAIGDVVNLAARLESANKQFGTSVLIDGRTRDQLDGTSVTTRPLGRVVVVGQSVPIEVFEVLPGTGADPAVALSERVVEAFGRGDFAAATSVLDEIERRSGPSRLSELYRRAMLEADEEFDGVLRLTAK